MRGIRLVIGLALVLAACDAGPAERAAVVCTTLCKCEAPPLATLQDECVDNCVGDIVQFVDQLSEECLSCIQGHIDSCQTVEVDCDAVCDIDEPPPPPPVEIVDAGMPI
jgi:hypothetical protein